MPGESDHTATIDDERPRNPGNAILLGNSRCSLNGDHLMERVVGKIVDGILQSAIEIDANEHKPVAGVVHGELMEVGKCLAAWRTPGCPEVEEHDLAAMGREGDELPVKIGEGESRRELADSISNLGSPWSAGDRRCGFRLARAIRVGA